MKKIVSVLLVLINLIIVMPNIFSEGNLISSKGMIIEAEDCTLSGCYEVINSENASGGAYINTKRGTEYVPSVSTGTKGELEFNVVSDSVKKYTLWIRCIGSTAGSDSVFFTVNNCSYLNVACSTGDDWEWKKLGVVTLSGGENTIRIHHREVGTRIDRLMLCELRYIPGGVGKLPESPEDYIVENPYDSPRVYPEKNQHPRLYVNNDILNEINEKIEILNGFLPDDAEIYEAEHQKISGNYLKYNGEKYGAGNGLYITARDNVMQASEIKSPEAELSYVAPQSGKYAVWIRCLATSAGSDSVWMKYNNSEWKLCGLPQADGFKWVKIGEADFKKGENKVYFHHREAYMGIDRMLITSDTSCVEIEENPENAQYPSVKPVYDAYVQLKAYKNSECDGISPLPTDWDNKNYEIKDVWVAQAKAFDYLINKNKKSAQDAYKIILNVSKTANFPMGNIDAVRNIGDSVFTGALIYDWCYSAFSEEERIVLKDTLLDLQATMETGFPPDTYACVPGHMGEFEVLRDTLSLGAAIYDEDESLYNMAAGGFFQNMIDWYNYMYEGEYHSQGDTYGPYRYSAELMATYFFSAMGYDDIFSEKQKEIAYGYMYAVRPDGQRFREGDSAYSRTTEDNAFMRGLPMFLAANYYKDEYINKRFMDIYEICGNQGTPYVCYMLFGDLDLSLKDMEELPTTRYFDEPAGVMLARTGWTSGKDSEDAAAFFKIGTEYFSGHQHMDSGQFQIYYKGGLATESGIYNIYGDTHDVNYNKRTIAHNCMLVYDPDEKMTYASANDGGQRSLEIKRYETLDDMLNSENEEYKLGEVIAHGFGPDEKRPYYSYLKGNLSAAYSEKVKDFERSFVFLDFDDEDYPAAVIVFDKVTSSKPEFKKTWVLHSVEKPDVYGNQTIIKRTEYDYNGKLINTALMPESDNLKTAVIGGKGQEFMIGDKNYEASYTKTQFQEGAGYRVEISPKNPSATDYFLNVMQVMDNDDALSGQNVEKFENDLFAGAYIGNSLTLFTKGDDVKEKFTLQINAGTKTAIFGIKTGMWKIESENGKVFYACADNDDKAISFTAKNEDIYTFTPLNTEILTETIFYNADNQVVDIFSDEVKTARVKVKADEARMVFVYGAVKNADEILENVEVKEFDLKKGEKDSHTFNIDTSQSRYFELFIWNEMKPFIEKQVFGK